MCSIKCSSKDIVLNVIKKKSIDFELLSDISKIEESELKNILKELIHEKRIFINSVKKRVRTLN